MKKVLFLVFVLLPVLAFANGRIEGLADEYFEIANAYAELKNYDKALEFYKKASVDKKYTNACEYNSARMYGLKNEWKESEKILAKLHKQEPENQMILEAYAYSLVAVGKTENGKDIYKELAEKNSEDPKMLLNYLHVLVFAKDYATAKTEVEKAILKFPSVEERSSFDKIQKEIEKELSNKEPEQAKPTKSNDKPNKD